MKHTLKITQRSATLIAIGALTMGASAVTLLSNNSSRVRNGALNTSFLEAFRSGGSITNSFVEFDISSLAGETVTSATFQLFADEAITGSTNFTNDVQVIDVFQFVGNGVNEVADGTAGTLITSFTAITAGLNSITISNSDIQSAIDNGDQFIGFGIRSQGSDGSSTVFGNNINGTQPALVVDLVPEPSSALLLGLSTLTLLGRRKRNA